MENEKINFSNRYRKGMVVNINSITYPVSKLERFCRDAFEKFGFTAQEAAQITDVLLLADLYGVASHGMQRLVARALPRKVRPIESDRLDRTLVDLRHRQRPEGEVRRTHERDVWHEQRRVIGQPTLG